MVDYNAYTVGWICAIRQELVAAQELLDKEEHGPVQKPPGDNNSYTLGMIGEHHVVIAALPRGQYGVTSAGNAARDMIRTFPNVRLGFMVGIGGGAPTPHNDIRLGDIVVGCPALRSGGIVQYDHGKAIQGQRLSIRGALNQPPIPILTAVTTLSALHDRRGHGLEQRPHLDTDRLYEKDFAHPLRTESCSISCDQSNIVPRDARSEYEDNPKVHYGLIASGSQLMEDALVRDSLAEQEGVLCFEMEAAGLSNHFPCIAIRGISDYADSHRNDKWRGYAAMMAAAYAKQLLVQIPPENVQDGERIGDIMGFLTDVPKIKEDVGVLKFRSDKENSLNILDWLTRVDYNSQQKEFMQQHWPGTGQWFLDSANVQRWLSTKNTTLFCPGNPGAGKTITTAVLIDHILSNFGDDSSTGVAFIYLDFQRRNEQKSRDLLVSLLRQLAQGLPSIPKAVKSLYEENENGATMPSIEKISQCLHNVVRLYSKTFIMIDAIDECRTDDGSKSAFLSEICALQGQTAANLFLTSRLDKHLETRLAGCLVQEILTRDEDITSYIDHRVAEIPVLSQENSDLEPEEKIKLGILIRNKVSKAVNGIFLLTRFHLDHLKRKTTRNKLLKALENLPTGPEAYSQVYGKTIMRIKIQDDELRDLARRVLTWLTFAQRRLTTEELRYALGVQVGSSSFDEGDLESTVVLTQVCMGLVKIEQDSGAISLIHYTTVEYLRANTGCLFTLSSRISLDGFQEVKMTYDAKENETARRHSQGEIATTCVTYLSFNAFNSGSCGNYADLKYRLRLHLFYSYAARNWGYHAFEAGPCYGGVKRFLNSKAHVAAASEAVNPGRWWRVCIVRFPLERNSPDRRKAEGLHLATYFGLWNEVADFLKQDPQLYMVDEDGRTPLSYAAEEGHEGVVKILLETKGLNAVLKDRTIWEGGYTPIAYASMAGHAPVVKLLLHIGGVDFETQLNYHGLTLLSLAAHNGHEDVVRLLLEEGANPDFRGLHNRQSPLSHAASRGHEQIVSLLLAQEGVEPDSMDFKGRTPLSFAAEFGHEAVVTILLATKRVDPDSYDIIGRTPLSYAARERRETVIRLLLATNQVDPDSKDRYERTPLSFAAEHSYPAVVKLLLAEDGVDPDFKASGYRNWTPLFFAIKSRNQIIVIDTKGVDPDTRITNDHARHPGSTPLSLAAKFPHANILGMLLNQDGVNPDSKDDNGRTPLSHAAERDVWSRSNNSGPFAAVFQMLLADEMVDPDSKDNNGRTPLSYAAEGNFEFAVKLLLERQEVNPDFKDKKGRTPLSYAAERDFGEVAKLLLEREDVSPISRDNNGRTVLSYAMKKRGPRVTEQLLACKGVELSPDDMDYDMAS